MSSSPISVLAPKRETWRVLYVEDSPHDARLCCRQLEKAGFKFVTDVVGSAEEFQRALGSNPYDLVLADYNLPSFSGMEALELVKQDGRDIPFILVTGTVGEETAVECIKRGATDYVLKDRPARLPLAIERALEEKTLRDERRRVERSRNLLAAIVESSDDAIVGQDMDGRIVSWNRAAERIYGYTAEEARGKPLSFILRGSPEELRPVMEALGRGGTLDRHEIKCLRKDGAFIDVSVTMSPIRDAGGPISGTSLIARDITAHKRLQQEFFVAQKMEAVGRLAAGVAHDFNNLLTVISGYSALALMDLKTDDPAIAAIGEINKAGDRAAALTRQLLAFCRKQVLEAKVLDLNAIVTDMDRMLRRLIGEDVDLVTVLDPALGQVKADPGQIEQVIMNLAVNARDAMAKGGKLTLETANVELGPAEAGRHISIPPGRYSMLAMTDTGTGMSPATQARIFEPFFTTKGEGTGLGLATVFGIVKQSGGSIFVYSEPGHGTVFKVYLPMVEEQAALARKSSGRPTLSPGSETVLVVEDEDAIRTLVCRVLQRSGYTVLQAKNGGEALSLCEGHAGRIDLLVSDVVMPVVSGGELAQRLALVRPDIKVLFMSGYTGNAIVHHGVIPAHMAILEKPFLTEALARKVREVLDRE